MINISQLSNLQKLQYIALAMSPHSYSLETFRELKYFDKFTIVTDNHFVIWYKSETKTVETNDIQYLKNIIHNKSIQEDSSSIEFDSKSVLSLLDNEKATKKVFMTEICSLCNGAGEVEWKTKDSDGDYIEKDFDCPKCDGHGNIQYRYIKKTLSETYYVKVAIGVYIHIDRFFALASLGDKIDISSIDAEKSFIYGTVGDFDFCSTYRKSSDEDKANGIQLNHNYILDEKLVITEPEY